MSFYFRDEVLPYYAGDDRLPRDLAANDFKLLGADAARACACGAEGLRLRPQQAGHRILSRSRRTGLRTPRRCTTSIALQARLGAAEQPAQPQVPAADRTWRHADRPGQLAPGLRRAQSRLGTTMADPLPRAPAAFIRPTGATRCARSSCSSTARGTACSWAPLSTTPTTSSTSPRASPCAGLHAACTRCGRGCRRAADRRVALGAATTGTGRSRTGSDPASQRIDAVIVFSSTMAQYAVAAQATGLPMVVDLCRRRLGEMDLRGQPPLAAVLVCAALEGAACSPMTRYSAGDRALFATSGADLFLPFGPRRVEALTATAWRTTSTRPDRVPTRSRQASLPWSFTGAMDYWLANADAVAWFATEVLPGPGTTNGG